MNIDWNSVEFVIFKTKNGILYFFSFYKYYMLVAYSLKMSLFYET